MPLVLVLLALISSVFMGYIGRRLSDRPGYNEAKKIVAEYEALKKAASKDKRLTKKLRRLEPEARRARRMLVRISVEKALVFFAIYAATLMVALVSYQYVYTPIYVPLFTIIHRGEMIMPASIVMLASYLLFLPLMQRLSEPPINEAAQR
jgi:uncharacterized membrane protein (DUF106 family)